VRRDVVEAAILDPLRRDLLSSERIRAMVIEMQREYACRMDALEARAATLPRELQELDARLERLRERLRTGDPDIEPDEIQAVIDRVEEKRQQITDRQPAAKASARILVMLTRAAEIYRREIADGLAGNALAVLKARLILRDILGTVRLDAGEGGTLFAEYRLNPAVLFKDAQSDVLGAARFALSLDAGAQTARIRLR
jgi:hypothetical protein